MTDSADDLAAIKSMADAAFACAEGITAWAEANADQAMNNDDTKETAR